MAETPDSRRAQPRYRNEAKDEEVKEDVGDSTIGAQGDAIE